MIIVYCHPTFDDDVAIDKLYNALTNPVFVSISFTNNWITIAGNVMNDDAKIIGITLAIAGLIGICVFCAPTILLPTTFLEYWTGILLSACCTNTTPTTKSNIPNIIKIAVINPFVLNASSTIIKLPIDTIADGTLDTIPANINIEIPFPIPFDVILSPNHINKDVPAISDKTTTNPANTPFCTNIPDDLYEKKIPSPSTRASTNDINFVYLSIFFLPSSPPSLVSLSSAGITIASNWITIEAVIYGVIDIANIESLENAPPEIMLIIPVTLFVYWLIVLCNFTMSTIGMVI